MNKVLGFERINERRQRPNKLINFIKPLKGPDEELAQDFLERVAAICYPIMKASQVVVMSLEEYPPNKEFWGRNFNAGEIIQLVLKSPGTGQWLPFKHVQMVMMHELAHCKQMNHSRDFWKVNNANRDELKALWAKNYTGEGLWGRGQTLLSGRYSMDHMPDAAEAPSNLCGGTYRSRGGRKRKRADGDAAKLTYAERKQRRIAKKFGVNGQALGADEYARFGLDQGRHRPSKPRVAGSKRGRELRVAAALARFDKAKQDTPKQESIDLSDDEYETDSDDEAKEVGGDWDDNDSLVKVCENEGHDDGEAQRELNELRQIDRQTTSDAERKEKKGQKTPHIKDDPDGQPLAKIIKLEDDDNDTAVEVLTAKDPPKKRQGLATIIKSESGSQVSTASEDEGNEGDPSTSTRKETLQATAVPEKPSTGKINQPTPNSNTSLPPTRITITQKTVPKSTITNRPTTTAPAARNHPPAREPPTKQPTVPHLPPTPSDTTTSCQICSFQNEPGTATCLICSHVMDTNKIKSTWRCQSEACRGSGSLYLNLGDYGVCGICHAPRQR